MRKVESIRAVAAPTARVPVPISETGSPGHTLRASRRSCLSMDLMENAVVTCCGLYNFAHLESNCRDKFVLLCSLDLRKMPFEGLRRCARTPCLRGVTHSGDVRTLCSESRRESTMVSSVTSRKRQDAPACFWLPSSKITLGHIISSSDAFRLNSAQRVIGKRPWYSVRLTERSPPEKWIPRDSGAKTR